MKTCCLAGITVSFLLFPLSSGAVDAPPLPTFSLSAKISETTLLPGAPLYVYLTVTRGQDSNPESATISLSSINRKIHVHIDGPNGEKTLKRPKQPWSDFTGLEFYLFKSLAAGESYTKTLIVHRWNSTTLVAGNYSVVAEAARLNFFMESDRDTWYPLLEKPFRKTFPLKILPPDDDRVTQRFNDILSETLDENVSWSDRYRALDTIVFAQGATALGTQLDLIAAMDQDIVHFGYGQKEIVTMLWYIVQQRDITTARALVALAKGPVFGQDLDGEDHSHRGIWPMLGWAIHELHRTGGPEVQAVTGELVDLVPDKPGLVGRTFQHGGMKFEKNY